jgi:hypothetical protein
MEKMGYRYPFKNFLLASAASYQLKILIIQHNSAPIDDTLLIYTEFETAQGLKLHKLIHH